LTSIPLEKDLLRLVTAGSVDDGKSTLIGRLLYDSDGVYEDELASVRKASAAQNGHLDLALITDGLRAEREQAITIDVAYRYFSTRRRSFIIADTPGHDQYTRNMVTGASTSDLALILVDARKGVLTQTRRHAYIAWLLGIRCIVFVVNKMDLVDFDREVFAAISEQLAKVSPSMYDVDLHFVPVSALRGDNVVRCSEHMPWYGGPSLLELLENVAIVTHLQTTSFRFPVQTVIRPHQDFRGYAGQIVSGTVKAGQEVVALPSNIGTRIEQILFDRQNLADAQSPQSVILTLSSHVDLGRGGMLADPACPPAATKKIRASLIWMSPSPLRLHTPYLIKHLTQTLCATVVRILHKTDIDSFEAVDAHCLEANEIGTVELETHKPMLCEPYSANRKLGSFILIDPVNNYTAAGGLILSVEPYDFPVGCSTDVEPPGAAGRGLTVWFTGLSGSGKTTICNAVHTELLARGLRAEVLDGDVLRKQLNSDLGFSKEDREENVRRIGFVAQLLSRNGVIVLVAAISPYRLVREEIKNRIQSFLEVHINAPLEVCEERDPKGLYKKARAGLLPGFTGIDDPYEPPLTPDVRCDTHEESIKTCAQKTVSAVLRSISERIGNRP